jgi:hypothetical protein
MRTRLVFDSPEQIRFASAFLHVLGTLATSWNSLSSESPARRGFLLPLTATRRDRSLPQCPLLPFDRLIEGPSLRLRQAISALRCLRVDPEGEARIFVTDLVRRVADIVAAGAAEAGVRAPEFPSGFSNRPRRASRCRYRPGSSGSKAPLRLGARHPPRARAGRAQGRWSRLGVPLAAPARPKAALASPPSTADACLWPGWTGSAHTQPWSRGSGQVAKCVIDRAVREAPFGRQLLAFSPRLLAGAFDLSPLPRFRHLVGVDQLRSDRRQRVNRCTRGDPRFRLLDLLPGEEAGRRS